jgi:hypothetical protein
MSIPNVNGNNHSFLQKLDECIKSTLITSNNKDNNKTLDNNDNNQPTTCIIDLRPKLIFNQYHIKGSTWFSLEKGLRFAEFPASTSKPIFLCVIGTSPSQMDELQQQMTSTGYQLPQYRFIVDETWTSFEKIFITPEPEHKSTTSPSNYLHWLEINSSTSRILWQPNPTIPIFIDYYLSQQQQTNKQPTNTLSILDLGSGVGRDAVALILGLTEMVKTTVHCVDRAPMLIRSQWFAERHNIDIQTSFITHAVDLDEQHCDQSEKNDPIRKLFTIIQESNDGIPVSVIVMSRFMNRRALTTISQFAPPGTFILIHHFLAGASSRVGRQFDVDDALLQDELEMKYFSESEYELPILNKVHTLPDSRPMISFIIRKKII